MSAYLNAHNVGSAKDSARNPPADEWTSGQTRFPNGYRISKELSKLMSSSIRSISVGAAFVASLFSSTAYSQRAKSASETDLKPPATPLIACDPYFSIWSEGDELAKTETTHWTGKRHPMGCVVVLDGKPYRVMGSRPDALPALKQIGLQVHPTRTVYDFTGEGIGLTLTFTTPALPYDMDLLSRPVTYLSWDFVSKDQATHEASIFFGVGGELAVNTPEQAVTWSGQSGHGMETLQLGSVSQKILGSKGDDHRIDWGYLYLSVPQDHFAGSASGRTSLLGELFGQRQPLPALTGGQKAPAKDAGMGVTLKPLSIKGDGSKSTRWLVLAYDDLYSIQYNHQNLRPYWRKNGWEAIDLLKASVNEYEKLSARCQEFDTQLQKDMEQLGGVQYAKLTSLAYRQCFAAGKFVADANGQPLQFSKENHSNGCVATSDVFYPMAPQFLLFGSSLTKSFLTPFMEYAKSPRWKFPFAPHDLGTYPLANGQVYGGGERTEENQMPVEESGNMLLLMAAVAQMEGNADYAGLYWERLTQWAGYLKEKGFDPENQLCTDDFAGHLAHNVNLSIKAICGIGAYAKLCKLRGDDKTAAEYQATAEQFAARWVKEAADRPEDPLSPFRLAFDRSGSWSQKYNLVWDKILDLKLFPDSVATREMQHYRKMQNAYGLPLDNRKQYTKLDWILWTACLTEKKEDFQALLGPVFRFLNETPDRSPMTDWYETDSGKKVGFTARPVVGGVFLRALYDDKLWKNYAGQDVTKSSNWAAMPEYFPPVVTPLVPYAANANEVAWSYTTEKPSAGWEQAAFDVSAWKQGQAGFGTEGTPNGKIRTKWSSEDIWMRREIELPDALPTNVSLLMHHDEDTEVYLNGILAHSVTGFTTDYEVFALTKEARASLKPGKNTLAVKCHQSGGGQYIDVTLCEVKPGGPQKK